MRVCFGGGGTDLPFYSDKYGGFVVSAAVDKFVYVIAHKCYDNKIRVKYSREEVVEKPEQLEHKLFKKILCDTQSSGIELTFLSDIPSSKGLGGSAAFTVGLLHLLYKPEDTFDLAERAFNIEHELFNGGRQDPYVSAFGGLNDIAISESGNTSVDGIKLRKDFKKDLQESLLFFDIGSFHDAAAILKSQLENDRADVFHEIKRIGLEVRDALRDGNISKFGMLQSEHWRLKRCTSPMITNSYVDRLLQRGQNLGAEGGKLVGAGGGGFIMFVVSDEKRRSPIKDEMFKQGLRFVPMKIWEEGSKVVEVA